MQIAVVLGLLGLAVVLFASERLPVEVVTLLLLVALVVAGILTPGEAFAGFSDEIIVILGSIFVVSGALQATGVMDRVALRFHGIATGGHSRLLATLMGAVGGVSAFMNNTTATAVFVPTALSLARQAKRSPSKLLMPVAYASILGGTLTLIGTSTNVAVSGFIARAGMEPLTLFEVTPVGLAVVAVGFAYMLLVGQRLLPDRVPGELTEGYGIREYLSEIVVLPGSHLSGQPVFDSDLARMGFRVLEVARGPRRFQPRRETTIAADDVLLVQGRVEDLMKVRDTAGIEIKPEHKLRDADLETEEIKVAEVLIAPQSELVGQTLKEAGFRQRYGLIVLAIYRHGHSLREQIGRLRLRMGDLLLVQGPPERLTSLRRDPDFWILEEMSPVPYRRRKGRLTVLFFVVAVALGGLGWLPLSIAFLAAALAVILARCVSVEQAYDFVEWRLLILIGGMTAFGIAMEKTGAAELLARWVVAGLAPYGPMVVLTGFALLTILLTQPMSNAAAALVVLPVALTAAREMGLNQRTFAIAVMLAGSISFIAPFEPSCLLVYNPGKYLFRDFVKVGAGLTVLLLVVVLALLPLLWPLEPQPGHGTP
jgi:di/tricarboxylate transporter